MTPDLTELITETNIKRLALACNLLLLGWITVTLAQPVMHWFTAAEQSQPAPVMARPPSETAGRHDPRIGQIAGWHLLGTASASAGPAQDAKQSAPETRLNLVLHGVYLRSGEAASHAIISEKGGEQAHYRRGANLPGNALLDEIHSTHVLLLRAGRYETLSLTEEGTTYRASAAGATRTSRAAITGNTAPAQQTGTRRKPPPDRNNALSGLLNIKPVVRNGEFKGMTIGAGSGAARRYLRAADVRLRQGDVITAINGTEITSAQDGQSLLANYTTAERLELVITRNDEAIPVTIDPSKLE